MHHARTTGAALTAALSLWASAAAATWTSVDLDKATHGKTSPAHGPAEGAASLTSQGRDLWHRENDVRFCYREVKGDFMVTCRLTRMTDGHEWAKAGILARSHPTPPHVRQAWTCRTPGHRQPFQWKPGDTVGGCSSLQADGPGLMPCWLRLERRGDAFTAYYAADADGSPSGWVMRGSTVIPMQDRVFVGLFVSSHDPRTPCTAAFDCVGVAAGAPPPVGTATATYFNNQTLTDPPALVRREAVICLACGWTRGRFASGFRVSPVPGVIGDDHISARWTGTVQCPDDGSYLFDSRTDDGVRLWIDGTLVIDSWEDQPPTHRQGSIDLKRGPHKLKLEWYENSGDITQVLRWKKPGSTALELVTFGRAPATARVVPGAGHGSDP